MDMEVTANTDDDDADMAVSSLLNITSVIRDPCPSAMRRCRCRCCAEQSIALWPNPKKREPTPARAVSLARLEMRCFPVMCDGASKRASLSTITTTTASDQQCVR